MEKRKILKFRNLIILGLAFLLLNICPNIVKGVSLDDILNASNPVGWKVNINDTEFVTRPKEDLFCVQYWYWFHGTCTFRVANYVQIRGNTATDVQSGKSVSNSINAELAYIVSHNEGIDQSIIPSGLILRRRSSIF